MLRVYLRDYHRHVRRPAVGAVVGDDGDLVPGVFLLQRADLLGLHVDGGKDKVDVGGHALNVRGVAQHKLLRALGHRLVEGPAAAGCLLVGPAGAAGACRHDGELEPGVPGYQSDEPLSHHACGADDACLEFIHSASFLSPYPKGYSPGSQIIPARGACNRAVLAL